MIKEIVEKMGEKLGESNDLIADDIASLYNYETETNENLASKDKEIEELKKRNETLTSVNANLLKSVPISTEKKEIPSTIETEEKSISWKECFDSKGNFIN